MANQTFIIGEKQRNGSQTRFHINNHDQIPADWGTPRVARRKSTVTVREPAGIETFEKTWETLTARPVSDLIIIQDDGEEYPIKREIFDRTYVAVDHGRFRKKAVSRLIQVPEGVDAGLTTLEGDIEVRHPDWVVIGSDGEVYANHAD